MPAQRADAPLGGRGRRDRPPFSTSRPAGSTRDNSEHGRGAETRAKRGKSGIGPRVIQDVVTKESLRPDRLEAMGRLRQQAVRYAHRLPLRTPVGGTPWPRNGSTVRSELHSSSFRSSSSPAGGSLTLVEFLDHADFVGLSRGELVEGIDGLVRRGFLRPVRVPREAFALTEAGAEALSSPGPRSPGRPSTSARIRP